MTPANSHRAASGTPSTKPTITTSASARRRDAERSRRRDALGEQPWRPVLARGAAPNHLGQACAPAGPV